MLRVFISHASVDKPILDDFLDMLQLGCSVTVEEVFLSCVPVTGIPVGKGFVGEIHSALCAADLFIPFVTPNYLASRFCMAELGGAWALGKAVFPLVVQTVNRDVGDVLLGVQTAGVDSQGLNRLFDRLKEVLTPRRWDTDRWEAMRDRFLEQYAQKFPTLPKPPLVEQAKLDKEIKQAGALNELLTEARNEIRTLQDQVHRLEQAKDTKAVAEIRRAFSTEQDQYDALVAGAQRALDQLGSITIVRGIFASFRNQTWRPSRETWEDRHIEIDRLVSGFRFNADDKYAPTEVWASKEHPGNRQAFTALEALDRFLSEQINPELSAHLEAEWEIPITLGNQEYWETVLLGGRRLPE